MISINILSQTSAILLTLALSIIFLASGIYYSRKYKGLNNYLIANRNIGIFSFIGHKSPFEYLNLELERIQEERKG